MEKKDANSFVDNFNVLEGDKPKTLDEIISEYKRLCDKYNSLLEKKTEFESNLVHEEDDGIEFTRRELLLLYDGINDLIRREVKNSWMYKGINLASLKCKIEEFDPVVSEYIAVRERLEQIDENEAQYIQREEITFRNMFSELEDVHCSDGHHFVRFDDELRCICCGVTTKDYDLTDEQLDFLTTCANEQGQFELRVKEEEEPLLQVLIEQNITPISFPDWPDPSDEEAMWGRETKSAEGYYRAEDEAFAVIRGIKRARLLDAGKTEDKDVKCSDREFLSVDEARELLKSAREQLILAKQSNSRFRDLMIEECKTAIYEALILSGKSIPKLFKNAKDDEARDIIAKAYYNILHRVGNYKDLYKYDCYTALPEINNRVLKMKLRREDSK